jgi:phytoene synthase
MTDAQDLDATVRRADPDRWLASRFIDDMDARADVLAIYAFDHELARIAEVVREPLAGEIRLTWWTEVVEAIFAGEAPRRHPVVEALAAAVRRRGLTREPLEAMIEARGLDIEHARFADERALDAYMDDTAGAVMALAITILARIDGSPARPAARAWSLAGLQRARTQGQVDRLPIGWSDADVRARVSAAVASARSAGRDLPVVAFPAAAYATLARPYAAGRAPSELEKRLRLTGAVLAGRI